jgi:hypothetical protein
VVLSLPEEMYGRVTVGRFQAQAWPNSRLAGLLTRDDDDDRWLVPLVFAEVRLPPGPPGKEPRLHSRLSPRRWVFNWDGRRRSGYLLVAPPPAGPRELRFEVSWDS